MNGEFDPFIFEAALAKRAPGAPEQQWRSFRLWGAAHPNRGTPAATSGLVFALPPAAFAFFFPLFFFGILSRTDAAQPSTKDRSSGDDSVDATQVALFCGCGLDSAPFRPWRRDV